MSNDEQTTEPTKLVLYLLRGDATDDDIEDLLDQVVSRRVKETQLTTWNIPKINHRIPAGKLET